MGQGSQMTILSGQRSQQKNYLAGRVFWVALAFSATEELLCFFFSTVAVRTT